MGLLSDRITTFLAPAARLIQDVQSNEYGRIILLIILVFTVFVILWETYIRLSRKTFTLKHPHDIDRPQWYHYAIYWLKYLILFPLFTFLGFSIFTLSLLVIIPQITPYEAMLFSIIIISTVRLAAYFHRQMAEDMAKLLPLAVLTSIITKPEFLTTKITLDIVTTIQTSFPLVFRYFIIIITLELLLKISDLVSLFFTPEPAPKKDKTQT